MINKKDVITIRLPFPTINSALALHSHMYICYAHTVNNYKLVKCQTFKNKFYNLNHRIIESENINRNPFEHKTLIDCDKLFKLDGLIIPDSLLATHRRDICDELFYKVTTELQTDSYDIRPIERTMVKSVNPNVELV